MEPVWFSPSAPGQELAALPVGVPADFKKFWLAVTMGERAGFRLAHGCRSAQPRSLMASLRFTTVLISPALSGLWTYWVCEELESGDGSTAGS